MSYKNIDLFPRNVNELPPQLRPSTLYVLRIYCVLEGISEEDQNNFLLLVDVSHWPVVANFRTQVVWNFNRFQTIKAVSIDRQSQELLSVL